MTLSSRAVGGLTMNMHQLDFSSQTPEVPTDGVRANSMPPDGAGPTPSVCEHCGKPFTPRKGTGGKPQRFCSTECRLAFHADAQRGQHSPTCSAATTLAAPKVPSEAKAAQWDDDGFDWFDHSSESPVVLPEQQAVAVYFNRNGELVI